jgi:hypothetical protein
MACLRWVVCAGAVTSLMMRVGVLPVLDGLLSI